MPMTAAAMGDLAAKRKMPIARLTTTKRDVSPGSSRPSSRNSTSRPASPTKPFITSNSPLIRPKAKVNTSALRRTSSSHTPQLDSPVNSARPPSPTKSVALTPISRVRSPPVSTIGIGSTRKSTTARIKASVSVTSDASFKAKSPSPELRNRPSTASSDILKTQPHSRERHDTILHHASSFSTLQPRPPSPSILNYASMRIHGSRLTQSELGISSSSSENHADNGSPVLQPIKVRSKLSAMAKNPNESPEMPPLTSSKRSVPPRVRVPSVSSIASFVSAPSNKSASPSSSASATTTTAYPITTATPAANPHRYPSSKPSPATASGLRSSFSSSSASPSPRYASAPPESRPQFDDFRSFARSTISSIIPPSPNSNDYSRRPSIGGNVARIIDDPANVPLPPQSPPTSSLSVSSHSSTSYLGTSPDSPVSFSFNLTSPKRQSLKETLDALNGYVSTRDDGDRVQDEEDEDEEDTSSLSGLTVEENEERKVKAEAKSNRKIADLEITNRSLLAINASLEKTKDRQAKEIRELKRKLRESRLILPPRAYRAVKSSLDPEEIGDDEEDIESSDDDNVDDDNVDDIVDDDDNDDDDDESIIGNGTVRKGSSDETYGRIKLLINSLLKIGRQALEDTKENHMETKGGTKVLTAEEVETWRGAAGGGGAGLGAETLSDQGSHSDVVDHGLDDFDEDDYAAELRRGHSLTPQPITFNGNTDAHNGFTDSIIPSSSLPSSQLPPILITEPS